MNPWADRSARLAVLLLLPSLERHPSPDLGYRQTVRETSGRSVRVGCSHRGRGHDGRLPGIAMSLRSPLSRVLGSGSAKEGTDHWWMQRVTAIALLILGVWFLVSFAGIDSYTEAELFAWVSSPFNAIMLLLSSITLAWHSMLGVQIVIEDYVHGPGLKVVSIILSKFAHVFLGLAAVLAILKIVLGGSA